MSECKHEWKKPRRLVCSKCGLSYIGFLERGIIDLRAKLAAAERHKQLFADEMNVYKKGCAVVEKQRDELQAELAATEEEISRVIEIDNATRKARVEEMEEFLNKYDIEYDCGWRSKIDDLISGLMEALEEVRKQCLDDHLCKFYGWFDIRKNVDDALQRYRGEKS